MKNAGLLIVLLYSLTGCMESAALLTGPTITLAKTGNNLNSSFFFGSNYAMKKTTGKTVGEHTIDLVRKNKKIDKYFKQNEIRKCEKIHSSVLSEIFFETLDEIDCENNS